METYSKKLSYLFYWIIIFIVAGSMIIYGLGKPLQFQNFKDSAHGNLSEGHKLMWHFYSYSLTYPLIIGIFEIAGGFFLLFNRTRIFGCILLTIILSNIIIQDYIYEIKALGSAIYYQILIFVLLIFDHQKIKKITIELFKINKIDKNFILITIAFIIALLLKYFETKII